MTKDEALKLALETLEDLMYWDNGKPEFHEASKNIIAIKEVLAQPAINAGPITPAMPNYVSDEDEGEETCPSCGKPLQSKLGGGVVCSARCGYWFCF